MFPFWMIIIITAIFVFSFVWGAIRDKKNRETYIVAAIIFLISVMFSMLSGCEDDGWRSYTVESSVIEEITYNTDSHTTHVEFVDGERYYYYEIPPHVIKNWISSPSPGKFFHKKIRGKYEYEKME